METLTCPFCNKAATENYDMDTGDLDGILTSYGCSCCERIFYVLRRDLDEL